jgi:NAD-dependent deacetylase
MSTADERASSIAQAARLLRQACHAVALTGAGSSTPSGIPDFRSPETGLWERADPLEVASLYAFRRNPEAFYAWFRPLVRTWLISEPNPAHRALAALEREGWLKAIITQNIDGLHQRAGSHEVLELHGHLREATCMNCYRVVRVSDLLDEFLATNEVPRCKVCGGVMKPNAVLFGEQLPIQVVNAAMMHVRRADVMLVVGSSLEVMPASHLPLLVHERAGHLIVVNLASTYIDDVADVVIHADLADVVPRIARACSGE